MFSLHVKSAIEALWHLLKTYTAAINEHGSVFRITMREVSLLRMPVQSSIFERKDQDPEWESLSIRDLVALPATKSREVEFSLESMNASYWHNPSNSAWKCGKSATSDTPGCLSRFSIASRIS